MARKEKEKEIVEEAEEIPTLPPEYRLEKGDRFDPYDGDKPEFADVAALLENYHMSLGDEPRESDDNGNPTPHTVNVTFWFDVKANVVKLFKGHNNDGSMIWEPAPYARKFVSSLQEKDFGSLLGEIRNSKKEAEKKFADKAEEKIAELTPEPVSFAELLDAD